MIVLAVWLGGLTPAALGWRLTKSFDLSDSDQRVAFVAFVALWPLTLFLVVVGWLAAWLVRASSRR